MSIQESPPKYATGGGLWEAGPDSNTRVSPKPSIKTRRANARKELTVCTRAEKSVSPKPTAQGKDELLTAAHVQVSSIHMGRHKRKVNGTLPNGQQMAPSEMCLASLKTAVLQRRALQEARARRKGADFQSKHKQTKPSLRIMLCTEGSH